jgi:predicted dehydrogenase
MTHIRWGIIGASKFAHEHMGPAIHAARGAVLSAVASRNPASVGPFQEFAAECRAIAGYDALIADRDIDAVYIPLPHHMHVEWTVKALHAGKHVLAEKPIAMQAEDFDNLIAARDATGLLAAEAYMIVHHPQWKRARQMVADGAIGRVIHITGGFSYDNSDDPQNIRNQAAMGGGGLRDIGVYVLGSARYVMGAELKNISAKIRLESEFDTFASMQGNMGEATYSAYVSTRMHPHQEMVFHGSEGLLRLTAPFNANIFGEARIELHQPNLGLRIEKFPAANHYVQQVEAFGHSIRTGAAFPWTLEQARGTQEAIDKILAIGTEVP